MKRTALMAVLLAGVGIFACSGPTAMPADAGFFPTGDTGGYVGTAGIWGVGGTGGTGGSFGGTNPGPREDGGGQEQEPRRDGGGGPPGGGGGGPPMRRRDAGPTPDATTAPTPDAMSIAECPAGAKDGDACMMADATCMIPSGDGGRGQLCTCRVRRMEGTWRCYTP
jgi:hypothetical protein